MTRHPDAFEKTAYWLQGEAEQNFGDFLTAYLRDRLFLPIGVRAGQYRLIGSALADFIIRQAVEATLPSLAPIDRRVVFWGCGLRDPTSLTSSWRNQAAIFGVRGPLSRDALGLSIDTPMADPGLLLPALHVARSKPEFAGRNIAIPHFHDRRDDALLLAMAGADRLLRPNLPNNLEALLGMVDAIASADFVLSASLHGAIIAAAYGVSFAFWDNGHRDLPFKWADFAASITMPCEFAANISEARALYDDVMAPSLRLPRLQPLLAVAPLAMRAEAVLAVYQFEERRGACAVGDWATEFAARQALVAAQSGYGADDWVLAALRYSPPPRRRWWHSFRR